MPQSTESSRLLLDLSKPHNHTYTHTRAFILSLICCLCAGSIGLFSLYAPTLQGQLGLTQLQINYISMSSALSMYLPVSVIGFIADEYGPGVLALASSGLFVPAYIVAGVVTVVTGAPITTTATPTTMVIILCGCFALIGTATSCLFFCAMLTCARLYPSSKVKSISAPVTAFGISTLWQSQLMSWWHRDSSSLINLPVIFNAYAGLYLITGGLAYIAARTVRHKSTVPHDVDNVGEVGFDNNNNDIDTAFDSDDETTILDPKQELISALTISPSPWLLFLALMITAGPLEMFLNNVASLALTIRPDIDTSFHIGLFAIFSSLARLLVGVIASIAGSRAPPPVLLALTLFITGVVHFLFAFSNHLSIFLLQPPAWLAVLSLVNGWAYGSVFSLFPMMVLDAFGLSIFGSLWGGMVAAPALGEVAYGFVYGKVYDNGATTIGRTVVDWVVGQCFGVECFQLTFVMTAVSMIIGSALVLHVWNLTTKK